MLPPELEYMIMGIYRCNLRHRIFNSKVYILQQYLKFPILQEEISDVLDISEYWYKLERFEWYFAISESRLFFESMYFRGKSVSSNTVF